MRDTVSARGHTSVILVLDMSRFVLPEDQPRFESIRGSRAFADVLRTQWPALLQRNGTFVPVERATDSHEFEQQTTSEEVGFISGIFRLNMLEEYTTPTYCLQKEGIHFPEGVRENLQFKELFADIWRRWDIYVRPTMTGMFVVRLTRHYPKATPIMTVASDVVKLQMVFDLPGALQRLRELEQNTEDSASVIQSKQASIREFLRWMNSGDTSDARPEYVPVQWKLAMEVCRQLVKDINLRIPLPGGSLGLYVPDRTTSTPLHDSYVIYHIEELTAIELVVNKARQGARTEHSAEQMSGTALGDERRQKLVTPEDIRHSAEIQRNLIQLIEGSILEKLRRDTGSKSNGSARKPNRYFPTHRPTYISDILTQDRATWNDEVCLLAPRAAVIIPSRRAGQDALFISNFSATTGKVMYAWYWTAMERMLEFVVEIRVLAQLMERASADVLQEFVEALRQIRADMLRHEGRMDYQVLTPLIDQVANLSRMVGMCQGLSNPSVWSRAEYAVDKARYLMQQQDIPLLLEHTERNVNNLTSLLDHADELYLADLSERNNKETFWLSLVLAGLSLSITLFALPSFWADLNQLNNGALAEPSRRSLVPLVALLGDILAPVLITGSLIVAATATWRSVYFRRRYQNLLREQKLSKMTRDQQ